MRPFFSTSSSTPSARPCTATRNCPATTFQAWIAQRHRQIEAQELIYVAHQLDFLGYIEE